MQISIFGMTEKRPVIYTLISIFMHMGDVAVVTNNRQFMRLMEEGPAAQGTWNNVSIFITDATGDEVWEAVGMAPEDFEYIIFDNLYNESTDFMFYVQGAGVEAGDAYLFDAFPEMPVVQMGKSIKKRKLPKPLAKGKKSADQEEGAEEEDEDGIDPRVRKAIESTKFICPWEAGMYDNIEKIEYYRMITPVSQKMANTLANLFSPTLNMPAKDIVKVANKT